MAKLLTTNKTFKKIMKKQIKQILENSKLTVKWKNFNGWKDEEVKNLLEATQSKNIKITGKPDKLTIKYNGNFKIVYKTNAAWLERDLITCLKMFYCYLGDKTKITSRFGTYNIN